MQQVACAGEPRGERNGCGSVAYVKKVVLGFVRVRVAGVFEKTGIVDIARFTTREHFVCVALVRNVKNELVDGGVEYIVQGDFRFDGTEVRAAVTADFGKAVEQGFADVACECGELGQIQLFEICRGMNLV